LKNPRSLVRWRERLARASIYLNFHSHELEARASGRKGH